MRVSRAGLSTSLPEDCGCSKHLYLSWGNHSCHSLAAAGDLQGALKRRGATPLPESTVIEWFAQICLGLKHVHDLSILHRCAPPPYLAVADRG